MKRTLIVLALAGALVMSFAATAWAGSFSDADYQGRAEKDPGTFVGFDLDKQQGVTKLTHLETILKNQCTDGEGGQFFSDGKGSIRVRDDNTFSGTLRGQFVNRGGPVSNYKFKLSGKLQKHGKAKGKISSSFDFIAMRRGGSDRCYTGTLDWKAERGAIVNPVPQGPRGERLR
jgi:hypothetical protein